MGGSAIGADLVRSYLYFEAKVPISVIREYELPAYLDSSTLVFALSYSGNTEETISTYQQAMARSAPLVVVSSSGKLKEAALKEGVSFIALPVGLAPRCAVGYFSVIPLCVLFKLGLAPDPQAQLSEAVGVLEGLRDNCLCPKVGSKDNLARSAAERLYGKFAAIYSSSIHFDACATRFKGQLSENAKALALAAGFPEMNHNEIEGWHHPQRALRHFIAVILKDNRIDPRVQTRMEITRDMLKEEGIEVMEIYSRGQGLLTRMFSLLYIADFISYYLAILYGQDPLPTEKITYLKEQLGKINV
jgi:glucose/mannose-6-phosphate isomerase